MEPGENGLSSDDFFGVVRRRHPDIDIIVLPQVEPTDRPVTLVDLADVPDRFDAELADLWTEVADGVERPPVSSRWTKRRTRRLGVPRGAPRRRGRGQRDAH